MTKQIIFKLGSRPMNEAAIAAGFQFAKGARLPVMAYFLEDEALFRASRFSFSSEVRRCGHNRGLEVHEVRRESRIAMRDANREVKRRSEAAQINAEFITLNGNGPAEMQSVAACPNVMVLGEHQTARQLAKDFKHFRLSSELQGVFMAGPRAGHYPDGPMVIVVHSLASWKKGLSLLKGYLCSSIDIIIYCVGDVIHQSALIVEAFHEDYTGDLTFEPLKRCDQARLLWSMERVRPGLLFALPDAPYIQTDKDVEALLRLLPCPIFIAL